MTVLRVSAAWRARLAAVAEAPPRRPRVPLRSGGRNIGSVETDLFARAGLAAGSLVRASDEGAWTLGTGDPTEVLGAIADSLRNTGLAHTWRNEQVAVRSDDGAMVGTVERGVARALGIATDAVHLNATTSDGRIWVQQRALDKPTDPGRWDTLVGGLVPAGEPLERALEREAWEEAGLRPGQMRDLRYGGVLAAQRPLPELAHGYIVERLHWFTCTLAGSVQPDNQDGEVAAFRCMTPAEVVEQLEADTFAVDAALLLLAAYGEPPLRA